MTDFEGMSREALEGYAQHLKQENEKLWELVQEVTDLNLEAALKSNEATIERGREVSQRVDETAENISDMLDDSG